MKPSMHQDQASKNLSKRLGARHALYESIKTHPVVYVTRDIERALGIEPVNGYHIVTNDSTYAQEILKKHPKNVHIIKQAKKGNQNEPLDTHELLSEADTVKLIKKLEARIVVFKPTVQIEEICKAQGWELLNPDAQLSRIVEEKISQVDWLGEHRHLLPPHTIVTCKELTWDNLKYVVQFNHGHTGEGTLIINSQSDVDDLKAKFPDRPVRKTNYITGDVYTCTIAVAKIQTETGNSGEDKQLANGIIPGNTSYQITGLYPFTDNVYATIGNDWALPHKTISTLQRSLIKTIADIVGQKLARQDWRGLFGIDLIIDSSKGTVYLLEINARQPASASFESQLQAKAHEKVKSDMSDLAHSNILTMSELHLASLMGIPLSKTVKAIPLAAGAQIVQRITSLLPNKKSILPQTLAFMRENFDKAIVYANKAHNADLLRIQSSESFMSAPGKLNDIGKKIQDYIQDPQKAKLNP